MAGGVVRTTNRFATTFFTCIEHNVAINGIPAQELSDTEENGVSFPKKVHFPAIFFIDN